MKNNLLTLALCAFTFTINAQNCIQPTEIITTATTTIDQSGYTNITGCQNAGQYAVCNFTATGSYTIAGFGGLGTDYITFTNNSNVVVLSGASPLVVNVAATGLYRVHLSSNAACGTDAFCHSVGVTGVTPSAPANDDCSNAILLTVPGNTNGTTANATSETGLTSSCPIPYNNEIGVWYTIPGNGNQYGVSLCSNSWDSKVFVYKGSCGALNCVTSNDNNGPLCTSSAASATWCTVTGINYYILVTGASTTGTFDIAMTQTVTSVPSLTLSSSATTICASQSTTLSATGAASYSWNTSATTNSIAVSPTVTSNYLVLGYSANGCATDSKTITITVLICTGLEADGANEPSNVSIYPNPFKDNFSIQTDGYMDIEISNMLGQVVLSTSGYKQGSYSLDTQPEGLYFIKVSTEKKSQIFKIVKQ